MRAGDNFDTMHFLKEHVDGDTAPLPAARICEVWTQAHSNSTIDCSSAAAGLEISYL